MDKAKFDAIKACVTDCYIYFNDSLEPQSRQPHDEIREAVNTMSAAEIMETYKMDREMWVHAPKWQREDAIIAIFKKHGLA